MRRDLTLLVGHELRLVWRDRRALAMAVVLPIVLLPVMLWVGLGGRQDQSARAEERTVRYALDGPAAELARGWLAAARRDDDGPLEEVQTSEPYAALADGEIDGVVLARPATARDPRSRPAIELLFRADRETSLTARQRLETLLERHRQTLREEALASAGISIEVGPRLTVEDLSSPAQRRNAELGGWATLFLLLAFLAGGAVVAADTLAGESERGTLETLLTSAADRRSIVLAKGLAIVVLGCGVAVVHLINLVVLAGFGLLPAAVAVSPATVMGVLVLWIPLALLVAAVLLWISGWARSVQRFQLGFLPLAFLLLLLSATALLPTAELRSVLMVVPVAGLAVAVREVLAGQVDPVALVATWCVALGVALGVGRSVIRLLDGDRAGDRPRPPIDGPEDRLARRIGPWLALSWALVLVAPANFPVLGGLHAQVLFNLVVVLLGGTLAMVSGHGLVPRRALALELPRAGRGWWVWPLALVGAPALLLASTLLARWAETLFPRPEAARRAWEQLAPLAELSPLEALAVFALLPAICEELAFRGLLLHGLRPRLQPLPLCLVSGLAFAFFHLEPIRFLPTLLLGAVLAWVTLACGSVLPAILWHALHNGLAVLAARQGIELEALPVAWGLVGALVTVALLARASVLARASILTQRYHRLDPGGAAGLTPPTGRSSRDGGRRSAGSRRRRP